MASTSGYSEGTHPADPVLEQDPSLPPVAVDPEVREADERRWSPVKIVIWAAIALLGGVSWAVLARTIIRP